MRVITPLLAAFALVSPLAAQVRESMTVEVIEVPVYVTDSAGKPIRNLPRDAFELRVDGKPQAVEFFDTVDVAATPAAAPRPARERRLYLLLFDLAYSTAAELAHAQKSAEQLINGDTNPADLFAVAKYVPREGVQFVSAFLPGRTELRRAIYTLSPSDAHDPLAVAIDAEERVRWVEGGGEERDSGNGLGALASAELASALRGGPSSQAQKREPDISLMADQVSGLSEMVTRLSGLEGQKHVVFFSEGSRMVYTRMNLRKLGEAFRDAGVFLHGVGPANANLWQITAETGGKAFLGRDMKEALQELVASEDVAYLLGFHRHGKSEGEITVKVKGLPSRADVRYRTGFGAASAKKTNDQLVLADIVTNDVEQSGVDLESFVTAVKTGAEFSVRFPREQIVSLSDTKDPIVEIYFYVLDNKGGTVAFQSKLLQFDETTRTDEGKIGFRQSFDLPPGKYVGKVLLTVHGSTAMGYVHGDFEVSGRLVD